MSTKISPIDIYRLLPKTNCRLCGEDNCMAFAAKTVNREKALEQCIPILEKKFRDNYERLWKALKPPVKEIVVGSGERTAKIGGAFVQYRHEFKYINPTAVAIDVTDKLTQDELLARARSIENFTYSYIGQDLRLDMIAVRSTSRDPNLFGEAVSKLVQATKMPLILCSFDPKIVERGLAVSENRRPLIYGATEDNWREMGDLALKYKCPLALSAPGEIKLLRSLTKTLLEYGVQDLVLDPGTLSNGGLLDTASQFLMLRRKACEEDELLGFPMLGTPITVWAQNEIEDIKKWREAYVTSVLITRYADIVIMHSLDGWVLLPNLVLRQNLYTDPRKPVAVEAALKSFGKSDEKSPLLLTTNFALTYYTVASDIESSGVSAHLMVVDTEGISVESAVAGRKLTAEKVRDAINQMKLVEKVKHKTIIIPGRASRLSGEIQELTGWRVLVGPLDSSMIPKFLAEKWPPREAE